MLFIKYIFIR